MRRGRRCSEFWASNLIRLPEEFSYWTSEAILSELIKCMLEILNGLFALEIQKLVLSIWYTSDKYVLNEHLREKSDPSSKLEFCFYSELIRFGKSTDCDWQLRSDFFLAFPLDYSWSDSAAMGLLSCPKPCIFNMKFSLLIIIINAITKSTLIT